jgi:hypothetical protein
VTADNPAPQLLPRHLRRRAEISIPSRLNLTIAPGDFLALARASLEELATRGVKVFYKPPGKSKNSTAVLPNKLSKSCELRPEQV